MQHAIGTKETDVLEFGVDVNLVFLLDLESQVLDEYLHQRGGDVVQARVEGGSKAGVEWNKIHPAESE